MVEVVDAGLSVVQVGWGDPFGIAIGAFTGRPAIWFNQGVVRATGQGQLVDIGAMSGCPLIDMMYLAPITRYVAARPRAATVFGVEHNSLSR